jgi:hypothetical protein
MQDTMSAAAGHKAITEAGLVFDTKYGKLVDPHKSMEYQLEIRAEILAALKEDATSGNYDNALYCLEELKRTDAEITRYRAMMGLGPLSADQLATYS